MTLLNRFRLLAGVLTVVVLVAALALVFNQRQTKAASLTATVSVESYNVGAAYGGTVTRQLVEEGDVVTVGEALFTVASVSLQQDHANGLEVSDSDAYDVEADSGTVTYRATVAGQITDLRAKLGNSLSAGESFARIAVVDSQYVVADYLLSPRDYERIETGAAVSILLPNYSTVVGTVSTITVATDNGQARSTVRIDSPALTGDQLGDLTKPGTPVVATLHLRDDGPLAGVTDALFSFLQKIGLT